MPAAWKIQYLGEIADISSGGTPRRDNADYWDGDIPWITTSQVDFCTINHADQHITQAGLANSAAKLLPAGTLLMALYGQGKTRGKVAKLGITAATNQACAAISIRPGTDENYVFHFLESRYEQIRNASNGGSQDNLSGLIVKKLPITLPSFEEQRAIASALSDMDALLAKLDQLIAKKRDIKQAAMQELLMGRRRLTGFSGEWNNTPISRIARIISGATPSTNIPSFWNGGINWCTPTDITKQSGKYLTTTERKISLLGLESCSAELLPPGALLLCTRATIGEIKIAFEQICTNQGFKSLVCHPEFHNHFIYYALQTKKAEMTERASGSTFLEISKNDLSAIRILTPQLAEQCAIATALSDMDTEITALEARREKTRLIKQGMMQELLSGRVRLI